MSPRTNLDVQSKVIARARAFVGTHGGLSYLPPLYGVKSLSFYSDAARVLDAAPRAGATRVHRACSPVRTSRLTSTISTRCVPTLGEQHEAHRWHRASPVLMRW